MKKMDHKSELIGKSSFVFLVILFFLGLIPLTELFLISLNKENFLKDFTLLGAFSVVFGLIISVEILTKKKIRGGHCLEKGYSSRDRWAIFFSTVTVINVVLIAGILFILILVSPHLFYYKPHTNSGGMDFIHQERQLIDKPLR